MNVFELITKINNFPVFHTNIFHFRIETKKRKNIFLKIISQIKLLRVFEYIKTLDQ